MVRSSLDDIFIEGRKDSFSSNKFFLFLFMIGIHTLVKFVIWKYHIKKRTDKFQIFTSLSLKFK